MVGKRICAALAVGGALVILTATPANAQVSPPGWWMTNDGYTTSQVWTFDRLTNPLDPDVAVNPFGLPGASTNGAYVPVDVASGRIGLIDLRGGAEIDFFIPNRHRSDFIKQCWWQITYFGGGTPFSILTEPGSNVQNFQNVEIFGNSDGSITWTVTFEIVPQPDFERIVFGSTDSSSIMIDSFLFGTHCVPEPATMATLGLGALALLRKRRRA